MRILEAVTIFIGCLEEERLKTLLFLFVNLFEVIIRDAKEDNVTVQGEATNALPGDDESIG